MNPFQVMEKWWVVIKIKITTRVIPTSVIMLSRVISGEVKSAKLDFLSLNKMGKEIKLRQMKQNKKLLVTTQKNEKQTHRHTNTCA